MKISLNDGNWRAYWGSTPLPPGARALGTVRRDTGETGALLLLSSGQYVQGNARAIRTLDQRTVNAQIDAPGTGAPHVTAGNGTR